MGPAGLFLLNLRHGIRVCAVKLLLGSVLIYMLIATGHLTRGYETHVQLCEAGTRIV